MLKIFKRNFQKSIGRIQPIKQQPKTVGKFAEFKNKSIEASHILLVLSGLGLTGTIFYHLFGSLFKQEDAVLLYTEASGIVKQSEQVQHILGTPVKTSFGPKGQKRVGLYSNETRDKIEIQFYCHSADKEAITTAIARRIRGELKLVQVGIHYNNRETVIYNTKPKSRFGF
jgi:import inner membrane translocase subunit TIM21